jgi:uncharacterized protein (DUF1015 family)
MKIRPFAALRPNAADASLVAAVPYDVVDTKEAKELAENNPKSFLHVSRPEIDLEGDVASDSPEAYQQARKKLEEFIETGTLVREGKRCFYAYRQTMGEHTQTGVVATFDTKEYLSGVLKKHEKTRKDKEDDRTQHIKTLRAQTGPAFLTYRDNAEIDSIVSAATEKAPMYDFTAPDGIRHTVWEIAAEGDDVAVKLESAFNDVPVAYIADGHHRSAAAARYATENNFEGETRWFMAVAFPASQLKILPYNRLVSMTDAISDYEFLSSVSENFTIGGGSGDRSCKMYFRGQWHELSWETPEDAGSVEKLDVSYLQENLIGPILGIKDVRTDPRISFMGGIRGDKALADKVNSKHADVAFSMNAVSIEEMMAIADDGEIMPPKSTWFEPKLRSGLFIHEL